jgi:hypothetical protein
LTSSFTGAAKRLAEDKTVKIHKRTLRDFIEPVAFL